MREYEAVATVVLEQIGVNLSGLYRPSEGEGTAMMANFSPQDTVSVTVIAALVGRGYAYRTCFKRKPNELTESHLIRMNERIGRHHGLEIKMNRNFIWLTRIEGSKPMQ